MMRTLFALLGLAWTSNAAADVVLPPPDACPPGAVPATGHMGPHCAATECTTIADCAAWESSEVSIIACAPAGLCVREEDAFGGQEGNVSIRVALSACRTDEECPAGIACTRVDRCIASGSTEGPSDPLAAPHVSSTATGCGALGIVGLLVLVPLAATLGARRADSARRDRALRTLLEEQRVVRKKDLIQGHERLDERTIARALAPIADRLRIEIDDEGETIYAVDDEAEAERRRET